MLANVSIHLLALSYDGTVRSGINVLVGQNIVSTIFLQFVIEKVAEEVER